MAEGAPVTDRWTQLRLSRKRGLPHERHTIAGPDTPRGPNGRLLCARCGTEIPKGAQKFCSTWCRELGAFYQNQVDAVREFAWRRSRGECCACGQRLRPDDWICPRKLTIIDAEYMRAEQAQTGEHPDWDAHHVIPLAEGGWHEPSNVVAICRECHKGETAALVGRLAEVRRGPDPQTAMELEDGQDGTG